MQCGAGDDLWHLDTSTGPVVVHAECAEFLPRPNPAEPTAGYQGVTGEPDGSSVEVTIIELPRARRYRRVYGILQTKCPDGVDAFRWETCLKDGSRFLAKWGLEAERLGWDSRDLFGLIPIPDRPHPSFNRMSRLDNMGLCWVLMGRRVTALSESTAEIENAATGSRTVFRKRHNE